MKVLWFTNSPCSSVERVGGKILANSWLVSLEQQLRERKDIELEIAYLSPESTKESSFEHKGVKYYTIEPYASSSYLCFRAKRLLYPQGKVNDKILGRMQKIVGQSSPDLIHIHGTEQVFGYIADSVKDIPIVYSIQGLMGACVEKFFAGIPQELIRKHESLKCKLLKKSILRDYKRFVLQAEAEKHFLKTAAYVIGRTAWDKERCRSFNPAVKYFHIDEIMRPAFYQSQWTKSGFGNISQYGSKNDDKFTENNPLKLVTVLSYGSYKGYETMLRTAAILKKEADFAFEWSVIGYRGHEEYVRISEKVCGLDSVQNGIRFLGKMSAEEMTAYLCNCDIFCHLSHIDNSPNAVCEAQLLGMPVICSRTGGTGSIVENGVNGLLYEAGNAKELAANIEMLQSDFPLAASLACNARETALRRHNPSTIVPATIESYNSIIASY